MKITLEHKYQGAAITQIAQHPRCSSIRAFELQGKRVRCAYVVNENIGIYIKYASHFKNFGSEYVFNFTTENEGFLLFNFNSTLGNEPRVFIVFVCIDAKSIACISYPEYISLTVGREGQKQTHLIVMAKARKKLVVGLAEPQMRGKWASDRIKIARNAFPSCLFV